MKLLHRLRNWLLPPAFAAQWPGCDITLSGGQRLHLVGSVHMGTPDMAPLPQGLVAKLAAASALIVEADVLHSKPPFSEVSAQAPLSQQLDGALYQQLLHRCTQLAMAPASLEEKPAWFVALLLQAQHAQRLGFRAEYGIDYLLLQLAQRQQKQVLELEGTAGQLALLRQLPDEGLGLLRDALQNWHGNARLLQQIASCWMAGSAMGSSQSLPEIFSDELHERLLRQRNQQWCQFLHQLPAGRYVVAAGALHLYGADNLPALLKTFSQ